MRGALLPVGEGQPNNSAGRGTESLRRGEAEGKGRKERHDGKKRRLPTVNAINLQRKTIFNSPSGCHMLHHCHQTAIEFKDACVQCTSHGCMYWVCMTVAMR